MLLEVACVPEELWLSCGRSVNLLSTSPIAVGGGDAVSNSVDLGCDHSCRTWSRAKINDFRRQRPAVSSTCSLLKIAIGSFPSDASLVP